MAFIVCILHRHYFAPEPWINNILLHSVCSFNRVEGCNKSVSIFFIYFSILYTYDFFNHAVNVAKYVQNV